MTGYLGLGSNVGDRLGHLRAARARLRADGIEVVASSSVYETEPQGEVRDQPDFLNACLQIETDLDPEPLVDRLKRAEAALGRRPGGRRHGPRPIDIDLLLLGERTHSSARLTLPHPELTTRRFVLVPLLELDRELTLPDGTRLADLLAALEGQRVTYAGPL